MGGKERSERRDNKGDCQIGMFEILLDGTNGRVSPMLLLLGKIVQYLEVFSNLSLQY